MSETVWHFLRRIDVACFKSRPVRKRRYCVGSAATLGWGGFGDHPHVHLALNTPAHITHEQFNAIIKASAQKTYWFDQQMKIEPYRDEGWLAYMLHEGTENLLYPSLRRPHPQ